MSFSQCQIYICIFHHIFKGYCENPLEKAGKNKGCSVYSPNVSHNNISVLLLKRLQTVLYSMSLIHTAQRLSQEADLIFEEGWQELIEAEKERSWSAKKKSSSILSRVIPTRKPELFAEGKWC